MNPGPRRLITSGLCAAALAVLLPRPALTQTIGTFRWQVSPFCNVLTLTVTNDGAAIRLSGFDDNCGAARRIPVAGTVSPNADGTFTFTFHVIAASGQANHTTAVLNPGNFSGPWSDSSGAIGTLVFNPTAPAAGSARPLPLVPGTAIVDGSITSAKIAPGAVDSGRIADGSITAADLAPGVLSGSIADGSVTIAKLASNSVDSSKIVNDAVTAEKLAFPFNRSVSIQGPAMTLANTGTAFQGATNAVSGAAFIGDNNAGGEAIVGRVGTAGIANASAVTGRMDGLGNGVRGFVGNITSGTAVGVRGQISAAGTGTAGKFENLNAANNAAGIAVVDIESNSTADLIRAESGGGTDLEFRVTSTGNVTADGTFIGSGADVAEFIDAADGLEAADVVEIDPVHEGRFRLAATASSTAVAGVLTTNPGLLMNASDARQTLADGPALALAGRVPVKVSAENGPIAPGDLLVTSSTPGHAMRAPAQPAPGTVVGKALGRLASGTGGLDMLVMLR